MTDSPNLVESRIKEFTNMTLKRRNEQGYARILVSIQRMYDNRPSSLLASLLAVFSGMMDCYVKGIDVIE